MRPIRTGILCATTALAATAPATAAPVPIDSPIVFVTAVHPFTGLTQNAAGVYAGYLGEPDASFPRVGDVFYVHGVVGVTGTLPDVPILSFIADGALAGDIELAVSPEHPVRCLHYPNLSQPPTPDPEHCQQTPTGTLTVGAFFGGRGEMQPGEGFEVQVPVRVTRPKSGLASGRAAQLGVNLLSTWGEALAVQHLVVAPAAGGDGTAGADATAPRASALRALSGPRTRGRRTVRLRLRLTEPARVTVRLDRRARRGAPFRPARRPLVRRLPAGAATVAVGALRPGAYRAVLRLRDGAGNGATARVAFTVRP